MGQRLLEVTSDLLVEVLKGITGNGSRSFEVDDGLPDDAYIISQRNSPYKVNTIELLLGSKQWDNDEPRTRVDPQFKMVCNSVLSEDEEKKVIGRGSIRVDVGPWLRRFEGVPQKTVERLKADLAILKMNKDNGSITALEWHEGRKRALVGYTANQIREAHDLPPVSEDDLMGFISQLAKSGKGIAVGDSGIGIARSPTDRGRGRQLWQEIFGRTDKESEHKPKQPPIHGGGGSWGRSGISGGEATKRLLQAMRSMAPGGWSDDRWESFHSFLSVLSGWSVKSFFGIPSSRQSLLNETVTHSEFSRPFENRLSFPVNGEQGDIPVSTIGFDGECLFKRPSPVYSAGEHVGSNSKFSCPIGKTHGLSLKGKHSISSGVSRLLMIGSPSTILFAIITIVVFAIKRMKFRWTQTQIGKKIAEAVVPPFANANSSPTVVRVAFVVFIVASLFHIPPSLKFHLVQASESLGWKIKHVFSLLLNINSTKHFTGIPLQGKAVFA